MQATSVTVVGWFYQTELFLRRRPLAVCAFALVVGWLLADATGRESTRHISNQAAPATGAASLREMSERRVQQSGVNQNHELLGTQAFVDFASLDRSGAYSDFIGAQRVISTGIRAEGPIDEKPSDIRSASRAKESVARSSMTGRGYLCNVKPRNPMLWLCHGWASRDITLATGLRSTFNHFIPFGHYYMGFGNFVGRQNIQYLNLHLVAVS